MGLFDRKKPEGKKLDWFTSDIGLQVLKQYTTLNNYLLEEDYEKEYNQRSRSIDYATFLHVFYKGATVPSVYFQALVNAIHVQPLTLVIPSGALVDFLKDMAKPYVIDDDGKRIPYNTILPLEHIVSVEKNPLLYFVNNFKVFNIANDAVGSAEDKWEMYLEIMTMLAIHADSVSIPQSKWLFEKSTYLNNDGILKTKREFLNTCKELSGFSKYFELAIADLEE